MIKGKKQKGINTVDPKKPLDCLFAPNSLTLIGASSREGSLGRALMHNIIQGDYKGAIFPINPSHSIIFDVPCYPNIGALPFPPELAIICTPANSVPSLIEELGKKGTKMALVISAGFGEGGRADGLFLQEKMLEAAKTYDMRIVGPNSLGIIDTSSKLNATFAPLTPKKGNVAFISQSGALLVSMLEWAHTMGLGFSKLLSVGKLSDLNFADYLEYLKDDPSTEAIILYIEAITEAQRFLSVAKKTVLQKPVIVMKSGRFQGAAQAVRSHSGALAGSDAVYEAAFRQAGLLRLYELQDVYDLLLTMNNLPNIKGNRFAILTNGGGVGVLATDALIAAGGELSPLSAQTLDKLNAVLPPTWSQGNPIDIIGDALPERYSSCLKILMNDPSLHTILLMHCPTVLSPAKELFEVVLDIIENWNRPHPDLFMVSLQQNLEKKILTRLAHNKIPLYPTPERAVRALIHLLNAENEKRFLDDTPPKSIKVEPKVSRILKELVAKKEQTWLDHHVIQEILTAYNIPVVRTEFASSPTEAKIISQKMNFPLVLKIASKDIVHKSDLGGVILNLKSSEEVEESAERMLKTVSSYNPQTRIEGFLLQPVISIDHGFELFLGGIRDQTFGPIIIFGAGGKAVEVIKDKSLTLAPLTQKSALNLIEKTRIFEQLKGYRDQDPIPLNGLISCLINLSHLLFNHPEISEIDINPLLADTKRLLVLDTRMRLSQPAERDKEAKL